MLKLMILMMLVTSFANAKCLPGTDKEKCDTEEYTKCISQYPCDLDGKSLHHLSKEERDKILACRLKRHMKCIVPDEDTMTLDPVYEYYKVYGDYL